ncbi:MAG: hypothetical protein K2I66_00605 [Bacteroidales bacterium]|nr:hypothetical protein [Bacteroidales bacterium]
MKKREMTVAEPEMVYGRAMQGCLMHCIVPKKDQSFFEDLAKVRSWKIIENQEKIEQPKARRMAKVKKLSRLEESIQQVERGEVFSANSAEEMCEQILGKGWKTKTKTATSNHEPNACTVRAMKDALEGRVFRAKSPQDLIKQILG